jgi:hypothetical protein
VRLADEVAEHLLADLEVRDDAVLQRSDGLDVAGGAPDHALGFDADRDGFAVADVDGDHGGLVQDDAPAAHVDDGVGRAEVDGHVPTRQGGEEVVGHVLASSAGRREGLP